MGSVALLGCVANPGRLQPVVQPIHEPGGEGWFGHRCGGDLFAGGGVDGGGDVGGIHGGERVGDDGVEFLAGELRAGALGEGVGRFEGEADDALVGTSGGGAGGDKVGGGFEFEGEAVGAAGEFAGVGLCGAVIGDGGGHDEYVAVGELGVEQGGEVGGGFEPQRADRPSRFQVCWSEEQRDIPARRDGGFCHRDAELPAGTICEVADGVDGLVGGAGGDENSAGAIHAVT